MKHLKECKSTLYTLYLYVLHVGPWDGVTGFSIQYGRKWKGGVAELEN